MPRPFYLGRPPCFARSTHPTSLPAPARSGVINAPALPDRSQPSRIGRDSSRARGGRCAAAPGARAPAALSIAGDCMQTAGVLAGLRRSRARSGARLARRPRRFQHAARRRRAASSAACRSPCWWAAATRGCASSVGLPLLAERDVILCDARDLDPGEAVSLAASEVTIVRDVAALPARVPAGRPVYVHFDVDILDVAEAPAMMFPVAGGPSVAASRRDGRRPAPHARHRRGVDDACGRSIATRTGAPSAPASRARRARRPR